MVGYAALFVVAWLLSIWLVLRPLGHKKRLFELGFATLCIFGGYYLLPSLVAQFGDLVGREVEPDRVVLLMQYGIIFLIVFAISYYLFEKWSFRAKISLPGWSKQRTDDWKLVLILYVVFELIHDVIGSYYIDLSSSYTATYAQALAIPDAARHIYGYSSVLSIVAEVMLLRSLKGASPRVERRLIGVLMIFHLIQAVVTQSRQYIVRFILVLLFQTNLSRKRRRVPVPIQVAVIGIGIVSLNILAMVRGIAEGADPSSLSSIYVLVPSEFLTVYLNSYLLAGLHATGSIPQPPGVPYVTDLMAFVPAAFAPWTKIDLSTWFVNEFFPDIASRGGGLAFGTLAEALVYFGLPSVFLQALILGGFMGWLSGIVQKQTRSLPVWSGCLYLFVAEYIYYPIRTTTFSVIGGLIHGFIMPYFICWILMQILRASLSRPVTKFEKRECEPSVRNGTSD